MNTQMVVSNIRMPKAEYMQMKMLAASTGVSVNEYIRRAVRQSASRSMFVGEDKLMQATIASFYDDMLELANSVPHVQVYDVSDEDAVIYGIYD